MSEARKSNDRNSYEIVVSESKAPVINKRCRDLQHDDSLNKTPKLSEYESPRLWQLMDQKLARQTDVILAQIESKFNKHLVEFENKILAKLDAVQAGLNAVTNRVSALENKIPQIDQIMAEVEFLKTKLHQQENSTVASDVRITGIPIYENEDLSVMFDTICKSIQHKTPGVKQVFRIHNRIQQNSIVIVKLESPFAKGQLLKAIAKYRRTHNTILRLSNAGFDSNSPIYVNECLSKLNHQIFVAAYNYKKQKRLISVFFCPWYRIY